MNGELQAALLTLDQYAHGAWPGRRMLKQAIRVVLADYEARQEAELRHDASTGGT